MFEIAIDYAVTILRYALLALIPLVILCACHPTRLRSRGCLSSPDHLINSIEPEQDRSLAVDISV